MMRIGDKTTGGPDAGIYVIAEVGGNHNGDPERAHRLVEEAARAGADAVKFQTYRAESLVHPDMEAVPIATIFRTLSFRAVDPGNMDRLRQCVPNLAVVNPRML